LVLGGVKVLRNTADVNWLVADQLGTPRMIFDKTGSLANTKRHDYLPFGEELYANAGLRTTTQGYTAAGYVSADKARQKFTEQERDDETGLDFMQARYFASTQGRFTSADPLGASARAGSPQSWNRYSYALNNPLRYNDPSVLVTFIHRYYFFSLRRFASVDRTLQSINGLNPQTLNSPARHSPQRRRDRKDRAEK
jgi:RHS repeat-associated protein